MKRKKQSVFFDVKQDDLGEQLGLIPERARELMETCKNMNKGTEAKNPIYLVEKYSELCATEEELCFVMINAGYWRGQMIEREKSGKTNCRKKEEATLSFEKYQQAIIEHINKMYETEEHLFVQMAPGAGKTEYGVPLLRHLPPNVTMELVRAPELPPIEHFISHGDNHLARLLNISAPSLPHHSRFSVEAKEIGAVWITPKQWVMQCKLERALQSQLKPLSNFIDRVEVNMASAEIKVVLNGQCEHPHIRIFVENGVKIALYDAVEEAQK
jgi:hypothetical protein